MSFPYLEFPLSKEQLVLCDRYIRDAVYFNLYRNNCLVLPITPRDKYTPIFEGQSTKYKDGYKKDYLATRAKRYGFQIRIADGREAIYRTLEILINSAYKNPCKPENIICRDYIEDEGNESGYFEREGMIFDLVKEQGVKVIKRKGVSRKVNAGLTFDFYEQHRRFLGR